MRLKSLALASAAGGIALAAALLTAAPAQAATGVLTISNGSKTIVYNNPSGCLAGIGGGTSRIVNHTTSSVLLLSLPRCNGVAVNLPAGAWATGNYGSVLAPAG
jgi:hypothetical protein